MSSQVLIIESEPWLGEHFARTLKKEGFHTQFVSDAYMAMDAINTKLPDIIVMNLQLSGSGGLTLLHELQSYTDTSLVPVIVCSDKASLLSLDDLRPYGVMRLLDTITMQPHDLPATIRSVLA